MSLAPRLDRIHELLRELREYIVPRSVSLVIVPHGTRTSIRNELASGASEDIDVSRFTQGAIIVNATNVSEGGYIRVCIDGKVQAINEYAELQCGDYVAGTHVITLPPVPFGRIRVRWEVSASTEATFGIYGEFRSRTLGSPAPTAGALLS